MYVDIEKNMNMNVCRTNENNKQQDANHPTQNQCKSRQPLNSLSVRICSYFLAKYTTYSYIWHTLLAMHCFLLLLDD